MVHLLVPCKLWDGPATNGRGHYRVNGVLTYAYRVAYEEAFGPIPEGLVIDHLCSDPRCVEPMHLEAVTLGENTRRHFARPTHCQRGHAWADNTGFYPSGRRRCLACHRERQRRYNARG